MSNASKSTIIILLLVGFLGFSPALNAKPGSLVNESFNHLYTTGVGLVKSPANWDKTDWILLGASAVLTTTSVYYFDEPVQRFFSTHNNVFLHKSLSPFQYSDFYIPLSIIAGYATTGVITKNNYTLETAYMLAESCIFNALLTRTVKVIAGRERPDHWQGSNAHNWDIHSGQRSFYSGHTSMAFAIASVIAWRYRQTKWVPWISYGVATMAGLQRISYNRHWLSDVFVGAVSATAVGLFIARNDIKNPLQVYPVVSPQVTGLSMVIPIR
ncbi:MAG: phosphatase PAP2 family protein [Prolixibacteraceae bacterium]|jgi:membrane-associated phospholipid phosphatase|nr:phosphatase PAP2 family protein [Prolixibacteraceae bacterium]